jgi:chemotaxis response regulator CheB
MPVEFRSLADRLATRSHLPVRAVDGEVVKAGTVPSPPQAATKVRGRQRGPDRLDDQPAEALHRPSVDVLMASVARPTAIVLGLVLTGMGAEGGGLALIGWRAA